MTYHHLQQAIYQNKINRKFNVTKVGKEIILTTEELGEWCDAFITNNQSEQIDAIGDIMAYCLGLSAMFNWNCDEIHNHNVEKPANPTSVLEYLPYLLREVGMFAKTYKKSNKLEVSQLDKRENFKVYLGNMIGCCDNMFKFLKVDGVSELEKIVLNNKTRTHSGQI